MEIGGRVEACHRYQNCPFGTAKKVKPITCLSHFYVTGTETDGWDVRGGAPNETEGRTAPLWDGPAIETDTTYVPISRDW